MKLFYYKSETTGYSDIKECEVKEYDLMYKVTDGSISVTNIRKETMNTYDYYFFKTREEAVKGLIEAIKDHNRWCESKIVSLTREIESNKELLKKYEPKKKLVFSVEKFKNSVTSEELKNQALELGWPQECEGLTAEEMWEKGYLTNSYWMEER